MLARIANRLQVAYFYCLLAFHFGPSTAFLPSARVSPPHLVRLLSATTTAAPSTQQEHKQQQQHSHHSRSSSSYPSPDLSDFEKWTAGIGDAALQRVAWLGSRVAQKEVSYQQDRVANFLSRTALAKPNKVGGTGGSVYNRNKEELLAGLAETEITPKNQRQVWEALATLERDMQLLDTLAGQKAQLSGLELTLLASAVLSAAGGPILLGGQITEFLAPAAAAFTAAIGIGAEYTGRIAVADGKEVAAATLQCAAEAEGFLANAERAKAIMPLCVGVGATAATFSLLVPVLLDSLVGDARRLTEVYLLCPLVAVLAAAVASLSYAEARSFSARAVGVGNRRFARSGLVGRTWLSSTELIASKSLGTATKWRAFSLSVLPAPILGALVPGTLPTKTIVTAALGAAEAAYFLTQAESDLSRATDAVALKARSAAVCDTYANQGARSAAILPFTSALSGLCAAATAAIVELPFVETLAAAGTFSGTFLEIVVVSTFPFFSALFAAAASVSKARCEVDAEAAVQAASTMALQTEDPDEDPVLRPLKGVLELISLTIDPLRRFLRRYSIRRRLEFILRWILRRRPPGDEEKNEIVAMNATVPIPNR